MNPIGRWKAYNFREEVLGIFEGHIIDVVHDLSAVSSPLEPLTVIPTKEEPFCEILFPLATNTVRFFLGGVKKDILVSPPEVRNAWFQAMFLEDEPKNTNWLVVQTAPYIKIEFV